MPLVLAAAAQARLIRAGAAGAARRLPEAA